MKVIKEVEPTHIGDKLDVENEGEELGFKLCGLRNWLVGDTIDQVREHWKGNRFITGGR